MESDEEGGPDWESEEEAEYEPARRRTVARARHTTEKVRPGHPDGTLVSHAFQTTSGEWHWYTGVVFPPDPRDPTAAVNHDPVLQRQPGQDNW